MLLYKRMKYGLVVVLSTFFIACASQSSIDSSESIEVGRIYKNGTIEVDSRQFRSLIARYNKFEKAKGSPREKRSFRSRQIALTYHIGSPKINNSKFSRVRFDFAKRIVYKSDGTWYRAKQKEKVLTKEFPNSYKDNTCYSLLDMHRKSRGYGQLLRLRNTGDHSKIDQYTFANTYKIKSAELDGAKKVLDKKKQKLQSDRSKFAALEQSLSKNDAYKDRSCVVTPSTEVIPHKPGLALSKEELDAKYFGLCIDIAANVTSKEGIYKALSSAGGTPLINIHQKWKNDEGLLNTPACAVERRNSMRATLDTQFRDTALLPAQVARGLQLCVKSMQSSCEKEIRDWENSVYEIRRAPIEAKHKCENIQKDMTSLEKKISDQLQPIKIAEAEYSNRKADYDSLPDSIPLSRAICLM